MPRRKNFDLSLFLPPDFPPEGGLWSLLEQRSDEPAQAINGNGEQSVESSQVVSTQDDFTEAFKEVFGSAESREFGESYTEQEEEAPGEEVDGSGNGKVPAGKLSSADSKSGRVQRACLELMQQHERDGALPTNGRFLFYEIIQRGVLPKSYLDGSGKKKARQPAADVTEALTVLRKLKLVAWISIEDETREITTWRFASTVADYVLESAERARIDCWAGKPAPLILCESRATKGVLERVAGEYLVPIAATNGQCGGFLHTDIIPALENNERAVGYIGDFEIRGPADQIEGNTRRVIEQETGRRFTAETWQRIALTKAQVDASPWLMSLVINKIDRRYKPPKPYEAVECEVIGQNVLERLLREYLDARMPEPLVSVLEREERQKANVIARLTEIDRQLRE
jgi:hypothetical protein